MAKRGDPDVLRLVVALLRAYAGMTQVEFGVASQVDQGDISRYERGEIAPPEKSLRRMAKAAKVPWHLVALCVRFIEAFLTGAARRRAATGAEAPDLAVLEPVLPAILSYLIEEDTAAPERPAPDEERREAEAIWAALERYPVAWRRRLIELSPRAGSWALAVQACQASAKASGRDPQEALELAELAYAIAERVSGEESSRVQSTCRERLASARQAAAGLGGAG